MLCDQLEGWDREGGREGDARGKRYGDICICITDSLCYKAETNTTVKQSYSNKNVKKKRKRNVLCIMTEYKYQCEVCECKYYCKCQFLIYLYMESII